MKPGAMLLLTPFCAAIIALIVVAIRTDSLLVAVVCILLAGWFSASILYGFANGIVENGWGGPKE